MKCVINNVKKELARLISLLARGRISQLVYEVFAKKRPSSLIKLIRYGFVAIAAFAVDFGLFVLLSLHIHYLIANSVSFVFGVAVNYTLSKMWVFDISNYKRQAEIGGVFAIALIGLALNSTLIFIFTAAIGFMPVVSKLIATAIVFFWNFFARHIFLHSPAKPSV